MVSVPARRVLLGLLALAFAMPAVFTRPSTPAAPLAPGSEPLSESRLPLFDLRLSENDIRHIEEIYSRYGDGTDPAAVEYYQQNNKWRKGRMEYQGIRYSVEVKAHGRTPYGHRMGRHVSLAVRLRGREQIHDARRFRFVVASRVFPSAGMLERLCRKLGLLTDRRFPVRVRLGGEEVRYFFEYPLSANEMLLRGLPGLRLFAPDLHGESPLITHLGLGQTLAGTQALIERELPAKLAAEPLPEVVRRGVAARYGALNRAIAEGDAQAIAAFFDPEYIAAFEALRLLSGTDGHGAVNNWVFYDLSSGLFYPVFHRDHFLHALARREVLERMPYRNLRYPLYELLSRNDVIRRAKYKVLYHRATTPDVIADLQDWYTRERKREPMAKSTGFNFGDNATLIRKTLEAAHPSADLKLEEGGVRLTLKPGSLAGLRIRELTMPTRGSTEASVRARVTVARVEPGPPVTLVDRQGLLEGRPGGLSAASLLTGIDFFDGLAPDLTPRPRTYLVTVRFLDPVEPMEGVALLGLTNEITGGTLAPLRLVGEASAVAMPRPGTVEGIQDPVAMARQTAPRLPWRAEGPNRLVLGPGRHRLRKTLVLPRGVELLVEAGTTLLLDPGVSFVVRGGLTVAGTEEAPVVVRRHDPVMPFGVFAALGNGRTEVTLRHLEVQGGSEDLVEGAYYSGELALHHHRFVRIDRSRVLDGKADDGLNVKHAAVEITRSHFVGNFADQVDLDVVTGVVSDSNFEASGERDSNGDGLDVSLSTLATMGNRFSGFRDKAISIGEKSRVILEGDELARSRLGVAVKSGARAYIGRLALHGNELDLFAYKKQKFLDGGEIHFLPEAGEPGRFTLFLDAWSAAWSLRPGVRAADVAAAFARGDTRPTETTMRSPIEGVLKSFEP